MARKEKKYHFIYKTINIINNKFYIGMHSTDNLNDGYVGSGTRLWYSINKYGRENHRLEILEFHETRIILKEREKNLVNEDLLKNPMCMNIKIGGEGGLNGLSQESIKKIRKGASDFMKMKWNEPEFRNMCSQRSIIKMKENHRLGKMRYDTFIGKSHSEETRELMKVVHKGMGIGSTNSQFGTCWITKCGVNKKINNNDLSLYISDGWCKGRVI